MAPCETFTDRGARYVDVLAREIVVGGHFFAHGDHVFRIDPEFGDLPLRFDLGGREMAAHALGDPLGLGGASAQLNGGISVLFSGTGGDNLQAVELKNGHRDLLAVFHEQAGHAHLLGDYTRAQHRSALLKS